MNLLESRALANVNTAHMRQKQKRFFVVQCRNINQTSNKCIDIQQKIRTNVTMKLQLAKQLPLIK